MLVIKIPLQHYFLNCLLSVNNSLRRQRFRAVLEQRTRNESQMARVKELSFNFLARPKPKIPLLGISSLAGYILRL